MMRSVTPIDRDEALRIAREDAAAVYGDLEPYAERAELTDEGWRVDYDLRDTHAQGGGPHYLIAFDSGEIIDKRYEQ
jgi:hypothetical protein